MVKHYAGDVVYTVTGRVFSTNALAVYTDVVYTVKGNVYSSNTLAVYTDVV